MEKKRPYIDKRGTKEVDETAIADDKILVYKSASGKLEYETKPTVGTLSATQSIDLGPDGEDERDLEGIYQNTSGKVRMVSVTIHFYGQDDDVIESTVDIAATTPPSTLIYRSEALPQAGGYYEYTLFFIVPLNYYYRVAEGDASDLTPTITNWIEWDLSVV